MEGMNERNAQILPIDQFEDDILIHVFDVFNLHDRKNLMLTSKRWFKVMNDQDLAVDCIWHFHHCHIEAGKAPFNVFQQSSQGRKFQNVVLGQDVTFANEEDLMSFLKFIGSDARTLKIHEEWRMIMNLNMILQHFPILRTLECDVSMIDENFPTPSIHLRNLNVNFYPRLTTQEELFHLFNLRQHINLTIRIDGTVANVGKVDGIDFPEAQKTLIATALLILNINLDVKQLNICRTKEIDWSDVVTLENYKEKIVDKQALVSEYLNLLANSLTSLKNLSFTYTQPPPVSPTSELDGNENCWFGHKSWKLSSINRFSLFYTRITHCNECKNSFLRSFPQLTEITIDGLEIEFEDLLDAFCSLKRIDFNFIHSRKSLATINPQVFSNMQNLTHLCLKSIRNDLTVDVIMKMPKMNKLKQLELFFRENWNFENFAIFTRLCPNVRKLIICGGNNYNLAEIASIFERMPYLQTVEMGNFDFTNFNIETFSSVIAPFAKNLRKLDLMDVSDGKEINLQNLPNQDLKLLIEKIPTLRINLEA